MCNYSDEEWKRINEIEDSISSLALKKVFCKEELNEFIRNKDMYIKKNSMIMIRKFVTYPIIFVSCILFGIIAVTTSKLLLMIIIANIISLSFISKIMVKYIIKSTEKRYDNVYNALSNEILKQGKMLNELLCEYKLLINKDNIKNNSRIICNQDNYVISDKHVMKKKLTMHK